MSNLPCSRGIQLPQKRSANLGLALGMGLSNISRCVDEMNLKSDFGKGTHLTLKFFLKGEDIMGEGHPNIKENGNDA